MVEQSVEAQREALDDVVTWTKRTAYGIAVMTIGGLGSLVILLLDKVL